MPPPAVPLRDGAAPAWHAHGLNRVGAYRLVTLVARGLPRPLRLRLAALVARGALGRFPEERRAIRIAAEAILAEAGPREREALVGAVFSHFAMCFADLLTTNRHDGLGRLLAEVQGQQWMDAAVAGGRGAVMLTAHVGNWELGGRILARRVPRPTHVVMAREVDVGLERFLRSGPSPYRFVVDPEPGAVLNLVGALRRGEFVAMQGDRAVGRGDAWVPFLGRAAVFPLGPFVLARGARVPVVPVFCTLRPDRRYDLTIGEPIHVERGSETAALARWVAALESVVRRHPEQWFNFFDLWGDVRGA